MARFNYENTEATQAYLPLSGHWQLCSANQLLCHCVTGCACSGAGYFQLSVHLPETFYQIVSTIQQ